jgi:hypothetical protein
MRWVSNPTNGPRARALAAALRDLKLGVAADTLPVLADLLVRRGIEELDAAARFLVPVLGHLHDPM